MSVRGLRTSGVLALFGLVILAGCGGEAGFGAKGRVKTVPVTGKVSFMGNPLAGAMVSFSPKGAQPAAGGMTDDSGRFKLTTYRAGDGAAEGDFTVLVAMTEAPAADANANADHGTDPTKSYGTSHSAGKPKSGGGVLPPKFSDPDKSGLSATVKAGGKNDFAFDLK